MSEIARKGIDEDVSPSAGTSALPARVGDRRRPGVCSSSDRRPFRHLGLEALGVLDTGREEQGVSSVVEADPVLDARSAA